MRALRARIRDLVEAWTLNVILILGQVPGEVMQMHGNTAECAMLRRSRPVYRAFSFTDVAANRKLWAVIPQNTVDRIRREESPIDP